MSLSNPFTNPFFPGGEFKGSLSIFMDYALQLSDSLFTVGATEEDRDAVLPRGRTPAPEHAHKMAEATTHHQLPESLYRPAKPESAHVRPAKPGPARVMSAPPESPGQDGVHQELSWRELPSIAHGDPGPAMAHEVPWSIMAARGPGSTMAA